MQTAIPLNECIKYVKNNLLLQQEMVKKKESCPILYLSGPPGIGKSDLLAQIAVEMNAALNVQYIGTMLIEHFGMPLATRDGDFQKWSHPEIFNTDILRVDERKDMFNGMVILALDDLHLATKTIQTYLFQLLTYRAIHNKKMPDNFVIICAGNRSSDKAGFQPIMAPIANRLDFIEVKGEAADWLTNFAIPRNLRADIITFIEQYPDLLNSTPLESSAWASSRSWTYTSYTLDNYEASNNHELSIQDLRCLVEGKVGTEHASKYIEYRKLFYQWNAKEILSGNHQLPDISTLDKINCYAFGSAIVQQFLSNARSKNFVIDSDLKSQATKVQKVILEISKTSKELVPLFLRSLIVSEAKNNAQMVIASLILSDKYLLDCTSELLKSVNVKIK